MAGQARAQVTASDSGIEGGPPDACLRVFESQVGQSHLVRVVLRGVVAAGAGPSNQARALLCWWLLFKASRPADWVCETRLSPRFLPFYQRQRRTNFGVAPRAKAVPTSTVDAPLLLPPRAAY